MAAARNQRAQQRAPQQQRQRAAEPSALTTTGHAIDELMAGEEGVQVMKTEMTALESITKSEVSQQLEAAHRWPRSIERFKKEAVGMATLDPVTAASCMYAVPRDGDTIEGKSVRLAEMCANAWGNLHVGARIVDIGAREVTAQAVAWDLEKNLRLSVEVQRSIVGKRGRFSDSMIQTTCMAAISIAYRNAVFRVVPGALTNYVYERAKATAVGDEKSLGERRDQMMGWFVNNRKVPAERVYQRLGVAGVGDITLDHLATLIGLAQAIKSGDVSVEETFPAPLSAAPAAPLRSKGAALDAMVDEHDKSKPKPAPAQPPAPSSEQVFAELGAADEAWSDTAHERLVEDWTPEQRRAAFDWARAFNDPTVEDAAIPERPAHTILGRQPGED